MRDFRHEQPRTLEREYCRPVGSSPRRLLFSIGRIEGCSVRPLLLLLMVRLLPRRRWLTACPTRCERRQCVQSRAYPGISPFPYGFLALKVVDKLTGGAHSPRFLIKRARPRLSSPHCPNARLSLWLTSIRASFPMLSYENCVAALDWLARAFGFRERARIPEPDGRIGHAEMETDQGVIRARAKYRRKNSLPAGTCTVRSPLSR